MDHLKSVCIYSSYLCACVKPVDLNALSVTNDQKYKELLEGGVQDGILSIPRKM